MSEEMAEKSAAFREGSLVMASLTTSTNARFLSRKVGTLEHNKGNPS